LTFASCIDMIEDLAACKILTWTSYMDMIEDLAIC
jgi:hypothetical protein